MKRSFIFTCIFLNVSGFISCTAQSTKMGKDEFKVSKTDTEWKTDLSEKQFHILREKGTEIAFTGKYWKTYDDGIYRCAGCNTELFSADTKYKSGCGWPSFYEPLGEEKIKIIVDNTLGMQREEVVCANCGGHLGHVFKDGPQPTGLRYCINSGSLDFEKEDADDETEK